MCNLQFTDSVLPQCIHCVYNMQQCLACIGHCAWRTLQIAHWTLDIVYCSYCTLWCMAWLVLQIMQQCLYFIAYYARRMAAHLSLSSPSFRCIDCIYYMNTILHMLEAFTVFNMQRSVPCNAHYAHLVSLSQPFLPKRQSKSTHTLPPLFFLLHTTVLL